MKKLFLIAALGFSIVSCNKEETKTKTCTECSATGFTTSFCEGDSTFEVKTGDSVFYSGKFNGSVDSFKAYASANYRMTCN